MKKVSVIVPVYNVSKYLETCLDSILAQTYPNIEIIIIDDKSSDNSLSIIENYVAKNSNIVLIKNDKNRGVSCSRNVGIDQASGEYISFIDSDDVIQPHMIERLVKAIEDNNVSLAMCKHRSFVGDYHDMADNNSKDVRVIDVSTNQQFLKNTSGHCWNKIYKRELFNVIKFPEGLTFEDFAVTYPIMIKAQKIAYVDEELYYYRRNVSGISISNKKIPHRGIIDIYYSTNALEHNYSLVRKDESYDQTMREIAHSCLFISAIDSLCWFKLPHASYMKIVNDFYYLANRKYDYETHLDNPIICHNMKRLTYFLRVKMLEMVIRRKMVTSKTDDEILTEVGKLIDDYNDNYVKVKK